MIRRTVIIVNRVLFVILLLTLPLTLNCHKSNEISQANALDLLFHFRHVELIRQVPLKFSTYHVQGLDITEQFYFVTSVEREGHRAWLFKIDRKNARLISKVELTTSPNTESSPLNVRMTATTKATRKKPIQI